LIVEVFTGICSSGNGRRAIPVSLDVILHDKRRLLVLSGAAWPA